MEYLAIFTKVIIIRNRVTPYKLYLRTKGICWLIAISIFEHPYTLNKEVQLSALFI